MKKASGLHIWWGLLSRRWSEWWRRFPRNQIGSMRSTGAGVEARGYICACARSFFNLTTISTSFSSPYFFIPRFLRGLAHSCTSHSVISARAVVGNWMGEGVLKIHGKFSFEWRNTRRLTRHTCDEKYINVRGESLVSITHDLPIISGMLGSPLYCPLAWLYPNMPLSRLIYGGDKSRLWKSI